jgi:diguanylate cyclase (GGDEF)-like protein
MSLSYLLPPLIASVFAGALLTAVLIKGHRSTASGTFSLIVFLTMLLGIFVFLMRASPDVEPALSWDRVGVATGFILFLSYYYFSLAVTRAKISKAFLLTSCLAVILVIALSPTSIFVQTMRVESYGYAPILAPGGYVLTVFSLLFIGMAFRQLVKSYRASRDYEERNRLLYIAIALALPVVGIFVEIAPTIYPVVIFGNIAFCVLASVAIIRYQLFDIRIAMRKGLAYLMISALVAIPYVGIILLASWVLGETQVPLWVYIILLLILALASQPLWRRVQRTVDRLFYRRRYNYLTALEGFSRQCTSIIDLDTLTSSLVSLTSAAMGATRAYLMMPRGSKGNFVVVASSDSDNEDDMLLDDDSALGIWLSRHDKPLKRSDLDIFSPLIAVTTKERKMLERMDMELIIPFTYRGKLNGILILSPKLSEEPYGADDIATLMVLARHASTAIENAYLYAESQQMVIRDGLTGLYNHRYFQERLREEVERGRRLRKPVTLMMLDIDMFHIYNELHGHAAGDTALAEVARVLRSVARKIDLLFRYGGEEFAVLVPGQVASQVCRLGERVRKAIEAHPFPGLVKDRGLVTVSVGVASYPSQAPDAETLVLCADLAMLEAKRKGRNNVAVYAPLEVPLAPSEEDPKSAVLVRSSQVSYVSTILALAAAIDAKDTFTYGHSHKVAKYAVLIGEAIGLSPEQLGSLRTAALLHDIGKIGIPDSLLHKAGRFTVEEMEEMKRHPKLATTILGHIPSLSHLLTHIVHHHERFDGGGYPDGLAGSDIPLESRILAIADAFDAISSPRAYRSARSVTEAIAELRRCAGTQFDPHLIEVFCSILEQSPDIASVSAVERD